MICLMKTCAGNTGKRKVGERREGLRNIWRSERKNGEETFNFLNWTTD